MSHHATYQQISQRLRQSAEELADVYVPFVEGHNGQPATMEEIIADPLASYQQLFDTVWTSSPWTPADRELARAFVTDAAAPLTNRMALVSAAGLAAMSEFDAEKVHFLMDLIAPQHATPSIRATVMLVLLYLHSRPSIEASAPIAARVRTIAADVALQPLLVATQLAILAAVEGPEAAGLFENDSRKMAAMSEAFDAIAAAADDAAADGQQEAAPEISDKTRAEIMAIMKHYHGMVALGVDINYNSFCHVQEDLPYFAEAANWFCPFTFEHPLLYNINAATRLLGTMAQDRTCDTDRFAFVLSLAPHLPEVHVVREDAVTQEKTTVGEDEANAMIEQLSTDMELQKSKEQHDLAGIDTDTLFHLIVGHVLDCFRFFTAYTGVDSGLNPFVEVISFWRDPLFRAAFAADETRRCLADRMYDLSRFDEALVLYDSLPHDGEVSWRLGYACERLGLTRQAADHYRAALDHTPDDARTLRRYVAVCRKSGDYAAACAALDNYCAAHPDDLKAFGKYADTCVKAGDYQRALTLYTRLDYHRPDDLEAKRGVAWCHMALGHYEQADELSLDILNRPDATSDDFRNAGHCALLRYDADSALPFYEEALRLAGDDADAAALFDDDAQFLRERGVTDDVMRSVVIQLRR